uniref:Multifunctional conjugation protein TraI n=1 Tax=Klebsiella pneumoniae TaxID=573 RepID=A0A2P1BN58_KLEPN|nr:Multifunctional conjugation protein TraI [Klebsiella pneumoniae]
MLPAGMNEDGVIEDMQAYDARLADEQTQRDMQRREEVNINHSHRHDEQDDVEIGELLMMSIGSVKSAGSAGNYYTDKDNYYVIGHGRTLAG